MAKKPPKKGSTLATMNTGQRSKRVAELVASHNTAAIPDKYLPANLKAKRTQAVAAKQPLVPGGTTTVGQFQTERKAAVNQKFGAADTELATQAQQVPGWYDDYLKQLAGIQQRVTDSYGQLATQAGTLGASTAAPGVTGTPEAAAAGLNRENQAKAMQGSLLANQGQAVQKFGELGAAGLARKNQRREEIAGQVKDLAAKKGDFSATYTADTRQKEFENAATSSALGLKANTAAQASADKAAQRKSTAATAAASRKSQQAQTTQRLTSQERQTEARLAASAKQGALSRAEQEKLVALRAKAKGTPGDKPLTPATVNKGRRDVAKARALIQQQVNAFRVGRKQPSYNIGPNNKERFYTGLVAKGIDPLAARAAVQVEALGGVTPDVYKQYFKRFGVKLPHRNQYHDAANAAADAVKGAF